MPVFTEFSSKSRDLRVLPSFALPLPRLTLPFQRTRNDGVERYEVVVVGVSRTKEQIHHEIYEQGITDMR